jgi:hypothetical protein
MDYIRNGMEKVNFPLIYSIAKYNSEINLILPAFLQQLRLKIKSLNNEGYKNISIACADGNDTRITEFAQLDVSLKECPTKPHRRCCNSLS